MKKRKSSLPLVIFTIAVVGVLLLAAFASPCTTLNKSKKLQTSNDAMGLQTALNNYYTEYERLPDLGGMSGEVQTDGKSGSKLLTILLGKEEVSDNMQNPKQITFLNSKVNKNKAKGGLVYSNGGSGATPEGLYDAWGRPFHLKFDLENDQEIADPLEEGKIIRNKQVIVYSDGEDRKPRSKDDIKTW